MKRGMRGEEWSGVERLKVGEKGKEGWYGEARGNEMQEKKKSDESGGRTRDRKERGSLDRESLPAGFEKSPWPH